MARGSRLLPTMTTDPRPSARIAGKAGSSRPALDLRMLAAWSRGIVYIANLKPHRLSTPQLAVFVVAALCDAGGQPSPMGVMKDTLGPAAGASVQNSYLIFLSPRSGALTGWGGWLMPRTR
jgi:hypothetical protein